MLTCNIGEASITSFDYKPEELRTYSKRGILKCPVCGGKLIYKNGEFKIAHFAHENKCILKYSEPESEEHLSGKQKLYNWLKTQNVDNLKLEAWIPETKQRPDLYFEYNSNKYVIEYQCTPISTEYLQRRELYKLAGINDIWVFGTDNYDFVNYVDVFEENNVLNMRVKEYTTKAMERESFSSENRIVYLKDDKLINVKSIKQIRNLKTKFEYSFDLYRDINNVSVFEFINNFVTFEYRDFINLDNVYKNISNIISKRFNSFKISKDSLYYDCKLKISKKYGVEEIINDKLFFIENHCVYELFNKLSKKQADINLRNSAYDSNEYRLCFNTARVLNSIKNDLFDMEYCVDGDVTDDKIVYQISIENFGKEELIFREYIGHSFEDSLKQMFLHEKEKLEKLNEYTKKCLLELKTALHYMEFSTRYDKLSISNYKYDYWIDFVYGTVTRGDVKKHRYTKRNYKSYKFETVQDIVDIIKEA